MLLLVVVVAVEAVRHKHHMDALMLLWVSGLVVVGGSTEASRCIFQYLCSNKIVQIHPAARRVFHNEEAVFVDLDGSRDQQVS